jgi:phosphoribosylformimino-5-aminoimidazole carboxamide ribotide isomerase
MIEELANSYPFKIMIAIDSKGGKVAIDGWRERSDLNPVELIRRFEELDVSFLYTNIDVEGLVSGTDYGKIEHVVRSSSKDVYVAGGITSIEDIKFAKKCGARGVIIGSALYTGKINYEEVARLQS